MNTLDEWVTKVCAELDLPADVMDRDLLLGLAGEAAHAVVRPAAPLTTFLVGVAVGQGRALPEAAERVRALAAAWPSAAPE
ncbi:MAG TPA: DUF6457 domain-containing protein [Trebonia sp.]|jgi:hypothetical protein|nr:DUF6457 domain-containing protein [Trebonia sp.]